MTDVLSPPRTAHGPWSPGIESTIPEELRPLSTLHRPENVFTSVAEARELRSFTGLGYDDVVVFRPRRLALHEILIRVSADLSVPDGERVEDLGINFREIVRRLLALLEPRIGEVEAIYRIACGEIERAITPELAPLEASNAAQLAAKWSESPQPAPRALGRVVSSLLVRHGRLWGPRDAIARVATGIARNEHAAARIGQFIEPWMREIAPHEGYRLLPPQERPIVMNTKGPSASGKTTIRPLQRELAGRIGADWGEFALVSPDIWRKQLLDYGSLGEHYKYAGPFTGEELRIVDQKLDAYMAQKANGGRMPHLLIDRFRFDSFAPHSDEAGSNLLTRFGRVVYMFFMVTPPASLVERAWNRGLEVGRYKAVDDTLAHAVEAYSGMPQLFFTWVQRADKRVHFEFLDNDVPPGERPLTAAFGWNDAMTILDPKLLVDVERFRRVNVNAGAPDELFRDPARLATSANAGFLRECIRRFPRVELADRATGRVYLRFAYGQPAWFDLRRFIEVADREARDAVAAIAPGLFERTIVPPPGAVAVDVQERDHTVGRWASSLAS